VFGLRMTDGISLADRGALARPELLRKIEELIADDLLDRRGQRVRLTARGRRYADSVAVDLLASLAPPEAGVSSH
jgi:oxygen-independent coproporphyrinogen-3 oxidase